MKNWIPVILIAGLAVYVISGEYTQLKSSIGQSTRKVNELTEETKATVKTIRETIDDLRGKFLRLESQYATLETQLQTKAIEPKPEVKITPKIVMHSGSGCKPCIEWIKNAMPSWKSQGWEVEVLKETESTRRWPWFEVYMQNGKRFEVDGPLTLESYEKALREAK
jgi:hypothetical protein